MPKFELSAEEMQALVKHFSDSDRIPPRPASPPGSQAQSQQELPPAVAKLAGARLVTSAGFGCTSCHQINNAMPGKVELKSRGPDLGQLGERIRRGWYDRWMPNPSRIVPRMEMPALVQPIHGLLNDDLRLQLAAVWSVLNTPGFDPPQPNPIRVVRSRNVDSAPEPASVLTDVVEVGKQVYLKPFLVGLSNRHNVLLDLRSNALSGWWIGDTARQRTRGKSWYWEAGGASLLRADSDDAEISLRRGEQDVQPVFAGQFRTEFDEFDKIPHGVRFQRRLAFPAAHGDGKDQVRLSETWTVASAKAPWTGFRRSVSLSGVPADATVRLRLAPAATPIELDGPQREVRLTAAPGACRVRLIEPAEARIESDGAVSLQPNGAAARLVVEYLTSLPVDRFPVLPPEAPLPPARKLPVVPGFEAVRLGLPNFIMPTALGWREDGVLVAASLKGRVWLVRDTDGDGLGDKLQQFSDELAAPYGLSAHDGYVDVLNKYALLRLWDDDGDGRADRTRTVASGWGHTTDYHDWVVGLPRDGEGNYYVAIPCQQDDRDAAGAALRGKALKLRPRRPTPDDPREYRIEEICGGLRFPMGIARDQQGNLFTTDNQGNYNPFNELNHLRPGRRYGFINKIEFRPDFHPPLTPPAIDIPHPWTRSVNGIAFLTTPAALQAKTGRGAFGPFEGHLIGCEYNGRKLIRMSLQKVGDTFQGAAYPFSVDPPEGADGFVGPNVCAVSPRGELYVGDLRDSAWGGGDNTGAIVRLTFQDNLPPGIAEVRANPTGFTITFTQPVAAKLAADPANYSIASYRRVSTPAYGGADKNRELESIRSIEVSPGGRQAQITLDRLREGFVYEFRLENLTANGGLFHPAEAHYTLRRTPVAKP